jgi:polyisoprenoid-binding protein YceI
MVAAIAIGGYIYISGGSGEASEDVGANAEKLEAVEPNEVVFRIDQDQSLVSFTLQEDLGGRRVTVVGTTSDVAGDILINMDSPELSTIGAIRINLRTLETDSSSRDRMTRSQILKSGQDEYEFTDFVPTSVEGLPTEVTIGVPFTFMVTGDLTLVDTTDSLTFEMTVTPVSETEIQGVGVTTVLRSDYGLNIPNVPSVANVTDEVELRIEFVSTAVGSAAAG